VSGGFSTARLVRESREGDAGEMGTIMSAVVRGSFGRFWAADH